MFLYQRQGQGRFLNYPDRLDLKFSGNSSLNRSMKKLAKEKRRVGDPYYKHKKRLRKTASLAAAFFMP